MEDISNLTDKELRELLLKFEDNPPPVNASTRAVIENKIRKCQDENSINLSESNLEFESSNISTLEHESNSSITPQSTPPYVRFGAKPDVHHIYESEFTPSYCRKSLNEYRDKRFDSPDYNLLDKPGCTPHARKLEMKNSKIVTNSGTMPKSLALLLIIVLIGIGIYFLLTWDPSFVNPIES